MKTKRKKSFLILFFIAAVFVLSLSVFVASGANVLAKEEPELCPCAYGDCANNCSNCSWYPSECGTPLPPKDTEVSNPVLPTQLSGLSGVRFLGKFLRTGINFGFLVGAVVFFFLLLTGAIKWIASGSDKVQLEGSQKQITHALVGLVILLSIFAIISVIESIFGISITNINLPIL